MLQKPTFSLAFRVIAAHYTRTVSRQISLVWAEMVRFLLLPNFFQLYLKRQTGNVLRTLSRSVIQGVLKLESHCQFRFSSPVLALQSITASCLSSSNPPHCRNAGRYRTPYTAPPPPYQQNSRNDVFNGRPQLSQHPLWACQSQFLFAVSKQGPQKGLSNCASCSVTRSRLHPESGHAVV